MNINVDISREQYLDLLGEAKEELRGELTREALENYLKENYYSISLGDYLRLFNLYGKASQLEDKRIKDLTDNEKTLLAIKWIGYDAMLRR